MEGRACGPEGSAPDIYGERRRAPTLTALRPNQSTEWLRGTGGGPLVGVIESFDILFEHAGTAKTRCGNIEAAIESLRYSTFRGDFRRQGEGILPTKGERKESLNERVARMPRLVRSVSSDPEKNCPICLGEWDADGLVQTQLSAAIRFARVRRPVCNMTPVLRGHAHSVGAP